MPQAVPMLSVSLNNYSSTSVFDRPELLIQRARLLDQAGVDRIYVVDHVVMGEHLEDYDGGAFPTASDGAWLEPLTVLSAVAAVTSRSRLATGILLAALRRPMVLAKQLATLDVISGGRLDIGVGVGWQRQEYEAAGLPFEKRGQLLNQTMAVCQALWKGGPASFDSEELTFSGVWCNPHPVQPEGVPFWISGRIHKRTLDRIVRFGQGWLPWGEYREPERLLAAVDQIYEALEKAGRTPGGFQVRMTLPLAKEGERMQLEKTMEPVPGWIEAGATDFSIRLDLPDDAGAAVEELSRVVTAFRTAAGRDS